MDNDRLPNGTGLWCETGQGESIFLAIFRVFEAGYAASRLFQYLWEP
jgi:hypothetical protein